MRVNSWRRRLVVIASVCLWSWATYAQQQQSSPPQTPDDSLADTARKARAEKKNEPKPKKVYTDDDVKPARDSAPPTAPGAAAKKASDASPQAETDQTTKEDPNGEKAWRARFQKQREKIARVEKELDVLQRGLDKTQVQYYPDPQKAMTEQNTRADVSDVLSKIDDKKKELADLKQAWDDMESDLRKAGGDPGWAR